ncbi:hypothetical protein GCK32_021042 [Trichostrongylus colubriformis]|uniref:Uncharacterized protein n=1 Tax=Trichostrongylus colubriformis TaxID=6319 RepID=A0AAN8F1L1_TRICO
MTSYLIFLACIIRSSILASDARVRALAPVTAACCSISSLHFVRMLDCVTLF